MNSTIYSMIARQQKVDIFASIKLIPNKKNYD